MGVLECPKHGEQGFVFVCTHVKLAIDNATRLPADVRWRKFGLPVVLCDVCAATADQMRGVARVDPSNIGLEIHKNIECEKCVKDWLEKYNPTVVSDLRTIRPDYTDEPEYD